MNTPTPELQLPANLRVGDLIAKTARVTLKDTLRVLAALDAVASLYDAEPGDVINAMQYDPHRPSPEQVAACEQAFYELRETGRRNESEKDASVRTHLHTVRGLV